jgi:hypothetical protein
MSGTGPRGREARREQPVKRVRNPEGGTDRGWNPGFVDLRAVVAVGAANLRKVAGAAQDSGGAFPVCLGGPSKSMGASRSAANGHGAGTADPWKTAQPSKRQGGSREAKIAATGVRDRAEGQTKPMKVGRRRRLRRSAGLVRNALKGRTESGRLDFAPKMNGTKPVTEAADAVRLWAGGVVEERCIRVEASR